VIAPWGTLESGADQIAARKFGVGGGKATATQRRFQPEFTSLELFPSMPGTSLRNDASVSRCIRL
jgi:hypothetical protein